MARIRTIKPSFFKNEELADLPMQVRLLFIGLWTIADKEGKLEDRPKRIKVELFPYDTLDVDQLLSRLQSAGFIVRYAVGEMKVIKVLNFKKHQRITGSEADSVSEFPEPTEGNILETFGNNEETSRTTGKEGKGLLERKGKEAPAAPVADKEISLPFGEAFKEQWSVWKDYKLKEFKFKFKSKQSETASITELVNLAQKKETTAIAIIQQSMANGWKGFFDLKIETQAAAVGASTPPVPAKELEQLRGRHDFKMQKEINYMYERFLEDENMVTHISAEVDHFEYLKKNKMFRLTNQDTEDIRSRAVELARESEKYDEESINHFARRLAVIYFLKQSKAHGKEWIFGMERKEGTAA